MPTYLADRAAAGRAAPAGDVRPADVSVGADLATASSPAALHLELAAFEMSVSYLRGYAPLPGLTLARPDVRHDEPRSVVVSRTAYEQQVIGLDFSTALGEVATLRGEAAYRRPFDYQNRPYAARPDLQYALGADHNFGSFSVIAQYLGRYVFDWQKEPGPTMRDTGDLDGILSRSDRGDGLPADVRHRGGQRASSPRSNQILFSQTAQGAAHRHAALRVAAGARDAVDVVALPLQLHHAGMAGDAAHRLARTDAMTAYIGAQVFAGPTDTLFGLIDQTAQRRLRRAAVHLLRRKPMTKHRFAVLALALLSPAAAGADATPSPRESWRR